MFVTMPTKQEAAGQPDQALLLKAPHGVNSPGGQGQRHAGLSECADALVDPGKPR